LFTCPEKITPDEAKNNIDSYQGKEVEVTGTVEEYKDKPEIVMKEADQLKLH
jgi:DNA/RNA endonuclease YhcR with UshA esterase domain